MDRNGSQPGDPAPMNPRAVVFSYHHRNTGKIAGALAKVLDARIETPQPIDPEELREYDLIGFGSVLYSAQHHGSLLDPADRLPQATDKQAFTLSRYGAPAAVVGREFVEDNHSRLRERLKAKGYTVSGEFGCPGWNTNSFLKYFAGADQGETRGDAGCW